MSIVTSIFLIGCNKVDDNKDKSSKTAEETQETNENQQDTPWYNKYNLETDKITIANIDNSTINDTLDEFKLIPIVTITDTNEVKKFIDLVDFSSWKEPSSSLEENYSSIPDLCVVFHNGTIIRMHSDINQGGVYKYTEKDVFYALSNYSGAFVTPKNLSTEINKLVKQHEKQK